MSWSGNSDRRTLDVDPNSDIDNAQLCGLLLKRADEGGLRRVPITVQRNGEAVLIDNTVHPDAITPVEDNGGQRFDNLDKTEPGNQHNRVPESNI